MYIGIELSSRAHAITVLFIHLSHTLYTTRMYTLIVRAREGR
jgi:hypothetical protein